MEQVQIDIDLVNVAAEALHEYYPSLEEWSISKRIACLLCFPDRYGSGKISGSLPKELRFVVETIKCRQKDLRERFGQRSHLERVQCQRPLIGDSLLTITSPTNIDLSVKLNSLLVLIQHPITRIEGYRVRSLDSIPFSLHKKLQPKLPSPDQTSVDCEKINKVIKKLFDCISGKNKEPVYEAFVNSNREKINQLDLGPSWVEGMRFFSFIPKVRAGEQIIIWKTWHSTGGSTSSTPKITSFLDLVPEDFLSVEQQIWYRFVSAHAPCDTGAGSSRGAWCSFVAAHRRGKDDFGCHQEILDRWVQCSDTSPGLLSSEDLSTFNRQGYLVIDIPDSLKTQHSAEAIERDFSDWFAHVTRVPNFSFRNNIQDLTSTGALDNYLYYTDRLNPDDPFNPDSFDPAQQKSRNNQKGGKLIPNDSGMGPGTTYVDCPIHLSFQFSQWVTNTFASFYGQDRNLLRLLCRFRVKMHASWNNTHIDIDAKTMI